jgi:hypothetical protein
LLKQNYPASRFKLLLVDDHSIDNTASLSWARYDREVSVPRGPPLPSRWLGKSHACRIGAQAASDETEIWVLPGPRRPRRRESSNPRQYNPTKFARPRYPRALDQSGIERVG